MSLDEHQRPKRGLDRTRFAFVALALGAVLGCGSDPRVKPQTVVLPEVVGLWASEYATPDGRLVVSLKDGATFEVDPGRILDAFPNLGSRSKRTLVLYGTGPNGDWWILSDPAPAESQLPDGCRPLVAGHSFEEDQSIVVVARVDSDHPTPFGIRLATVPGLALPEPLDSSGYVHGTTFCLDGSGRIQSTY